MRLLLDTHIWLWSQLSPEKLSRQVAKALGSNRNERWLSSVSLWELVILSEKGRVTLDADVEDWVARVRKAAPVVEAPLTHEVALETLRIKLPHRDPADRLLAATAKVFDLTLVTADERLMGVGGISTLANR